MNHEELEPEAHQVDVFAVKTSTLSREEDEVTAGVIGCAIAVHRTLGPGEVPVRVSYRGVDIPGQRVDLIVERLVVVELKSVTHLDRVHQAQVISYLKTTRQRAGLLINFRVPLLRVGIRRIVL